MTDVFVAGAAGNTGHSVTEQLQQRGVSVRAMVRRYQDALPGSAEQVVADFDDPGSVRAALDEVRRAYLVTPSSEQAQKQQCDFIDAAREAGVERLVLLSQLGARTDSSVRFLRYHAAVEQHLHDSGIDYTILRPNLYFQGLFAVADPIADHQVLPAPIDNAPVSAVDVRDIAAVAAAVLTGSGHRNQTYTITGPRAITHTDMAAAIADATGQPVHFTPTAPDDFAAALDGILPAWQIEGLLEDYAHYRRGEASATSAVVEKITGRPATGFDQFARDYGDRFTRT